MFSSRDSRTGDAPSPSTLERLLGNFQDLPNEWMEADRQIPLQEHLAYWQRLIEGAPLLLDLPTDHVYPAVRTSRSVSQSIELPATSPLMLFAAFLILLCRVSGQEDFLVGIPSASRARTASGEVIGRVSNNVVVHADLSGNPTGTAFLTRIRDLCLEGQAHQEMPFEYLLEHLPEAYKAAYLTHRSLFQAMFVIQEGAIPGVADPAVCDVLLNVSARADGVQVQLVCNADVFDVATARRMAEHFQTLLAALIAHPQERVMQLALLGEDERHQLLVEWNQTAADYPGSTCLHECFETQVEQTPEVIALVYAEQQITYEELNRRANQLAHALQQLGVGREITVGLCLERSLDMVIALLAILKAEGVYVPLDPAYPPERLAFMLADARVDVLLTQPSVQAHLPDTSATLLYLHSDGSPFAQQPVSPPRDRTTAENLAYIMYTSGSTGQPKGVCVSHQAVVRLVKGTTYARFTADQVFLQYAPIAFDAATFEIWGALLNGARLVLAPAGTGSLEELGQTLEREHITTLWLTAGLFHLMVDESLPALGNLQQLLAGGDVLSVPHVRRVLEQPIRPTVINGYGPTENTTFTCCYPMTTPEHIGATVPIGKPIANSQVYVLDAHWQPVPVGVPGELYIGGAGLARGYWNRPDLTAERFLPHPYSTKAGDRLYRTGDRVRYRPDGTLEFLGRLDQQVKVRGFRIEPGEIEAALSSHPGVREVVVLARREGGDTRLVAYVVPRDEYSCTAGELRRYLQGHLPDPMVPAAFVLLRALPRSPNGKLDRQALPAPDRESWGQAQVYAAPRTATEALVAEIWSEIFALPAGTQIGIHDNFFVLGGHSLLAAKLLSRLRTRLQVEAPLRLVFEAPTIAELSQRLDLERQEHHQAAVQSPTLARHEGEEVDDDLLSELLDQIEQLSDSAAQVALAQEGALDL